MFAHHPHICLFQPEIPQNAGNIGRLAAATQSRLHFVKPLGFSTDDRNLLRAGLDYWPFLDLEIHEDFQHVAERFGRRMAFFSKHAETCYTQMPLERDVFIFGRETSGLPETLHKTYAHQFYRIPIFHPGVRSLNLANAVSIVVYSYLNRAGLMSQANEKKNE